MPDAGEDTNIDSDYGGRLRRQYWCGWKYLKTCRGQMNCWMQMEDMAVWWTRPYPRAGRLWWNFSIILVLDRKEKKTTEVGKLREGNMEEGRLG
jgi:hypothetical protein